MRHLNPRQIARKAGVTLEEAEAELTTTYSDQMVPTSNPNVRLYPEWIARELKPLPKPVDKELLFDTKRPLGTIAEHELEGLFFCSKDDLRAELERLNLYSDGDLVAHTDAVSVRYYPNRCVHLLSPTLSHKPDSKRVPKNWMHVKEVKKATGCSIARIMKTADAKALKWCLYAPDKPAHPYVSPTEFERLLSAVKGPPDEYINMTVAAKQLGLGYNVFSDACSHLNIETKIYSASNNYPARHILRDQLEIIEAHCRQSKKPLSGMLCADEIAWFFDESAEWVRAKMKSLGAVTERYKKRANNRWAEHYSAADIATLKEQSDFTAYEPVPESGWHSVAETVAALGTWPRGLENMMNEFAYIDRPRRFLCPEGNIAEFYSDEAVNYLLREKALKVLAAQPPLQRTTH